MNFARRFVFLALVCTLSIPLLAQTATAPGNQTPSRNSEGQPKRQYSVNVARFTTMGEKVRGPVTIVLKNVNVVRYNVQVGQTVTYSAGPDLSKLGFIPPVAAAPTPLVKATISRELFRPPDWNQEIEVVFSTLTTDSNLLQDNLRDLTSEVGEAVNKTNDATTALNTLVRGSDALLQTQGGVGQIITEIGTVKGTIEGAQAKPWPVEDIMQLKNNIEKLEDWINRLPQEKPSEWTDWYKDKRRDYDGLKTSVADLASKVAEIDSGSQKAQAYKAAIASLASWQSILSAIQKGGENSFTWSVPEGCGFAFSGNKQTRVFLSKVDRLASKPASPATQEIVTVVCSSPLTFSAGFGFARLTESNYAFVQSAGTDANGNPAVVSKFGLTSQSSFRTVPVVLVNTRLKEWNEKWAFHFSTGAAVNLSSGAVGNNVEYVVGGSLSFRRAAMVTVGVEVGRESSLAGGFKVGDVVPPNLSEPPIQQKWAVGPAFMFTYIFR
ncbi:MAG: hypothetical protein P8Z30_18285 [Acidobacteriota bacterium]